MTSPNQHITNRPRRLRRTESLRPLWCGKTQLTV